VAFGQRYAITPQQVLGLIFMDVHRSLRASSEEGQQTETDASVRLCLKAEEDVSEELRPPQAVAKPAKNPRRSLRQLRFSPGATSGNRTPRRGIGVFAPMRQGESDAPFAPDRRLASAIRGRTGVSR